MIANVLVSYAYWNDQVLELKKIPEDNLRLVIDSGAFTAHTSGKPIKLDDYCHFIKNIPIKPWRYFNLDVIGDPKATYENYKIMLDRGFKPIPIFTPGEDWSMFDKFYKTSDVVGIGGLVGSGKKKINYIKRAMQVVGDRRVHLLGVSHGDIIAYFKPYMCDSSDNSTARRYGVLMLYHGNNVWSKIKRKSMSDLPSPQIQRAIRSYGYDPVMLGREHNWRGTWSYANLLTRQCYLRYSVEVEIIFNTRYFMAIQGSEIPEIVEVFNREVKLAA